LRAGSHFAHPAWADRHYRAVWYISHSIRDARQLFCAPAQGL